MFSHFIIYRNLVPDSKGNNLHITTKKKLEDLVQEKYHLRILNTSNTFLLVHLATLFPKCFKYFKSILLKIQSIF